MNEKNEIEEIKKNIELTTKIYSEHGGFGKDIFPSMTIKDLKKGYIECNLSLIKEFTNSLGFLHGGMIATVFDGLGTYAYVSTQKPNSYGYNIVTINININYIQSAQIGENIIFKSEVEKLTKSLCFIKSSAHKSDGSLIANSQTVYKIFPPKL